MIPRDTIDEIIERAPIVEIIGRDVKLRRAGREWRGLSPFKQERTPSFFVNDVKRRFFDFASGLHGTVIRFLMELRRWSFPESCEFIAAEVGVNLTGTQATEEDRAQRALKMETQAVIDRAQLWFLHQMRTRPEGRAYAASRGLTDATIKQMGIGYAPDVPYALLGALRAFSPAALESSGLFVADQPAVAFFRDRLTFPIRDRRGLIVSYGGRAIGDEQPKYLNGRETILYHKARTLYNLTDAARSIKDAGAALVMEGYIDVAVARQHGIANVVAPLGSALSLEQSWLLWRQAPEILVCLDGDAAGDRASASLLETTLPALAGDRRVAFVRLPAGLDPDDCLRINGRPGFDACIQSAESCADRLWRKIADQLGGSVADQEAQARDLAHRYTAEIADQHLRESYRRALSDRAFNLGRGREESTSAPNHRFHHPGVAAREAAIAVAVASEPRYLASAAERIGALNFGSPTVRDIVTLALNAASVGANLDSDAHARDLAILRGCVPRPLPAFIASYDVASFDAALDVQAEQERRRRLTQF